jgi:hypothetical protein
MKPAIHFLLLLTATAVFIGSMAQAQETCETIFKAVDPIATNRDFVLQMLQKANAAYYNIHIQGRLVPVVLVNKSTVDRLLPLLEQTVGVQVMTKKGWPNDHGAFRFGNYLIDAFIPGQRQVGEINQTGLSWKTSKDSAVFLDKIADLIGEAAFVVSPDEMQKIDFYERVLRAAFYRVPFLMGDQTIYQRFPNVLQECGGYCFEFSHSLRLQNAAQALAHRLEVMDPKSAIRSAHQTDIQLFQNEVRSLLLSANLFDARMMSEELLNGPSVRRLTEKFVPVTWDEKQRTLFLEWLVSEQAVKGMSEFVNAVGFNRGTDPLSNAHLPRANVIFVWDPNANEKSFLDATYSGRGQVFNIPAGAKK